MQFFKIFCLQIRSQIFSQYQANRTQQKVFFGKQFYIFAYNSETTRDNDIQFSLYNRQKHSTGHRSKFFSQYQANRIQQKVFFGKQFYIFAYNSETMRDNNDIQFSLYDRKEHQLFAKIYFRPQIPRLLN